MKERTKLLLIVGAFLAAYFLPIEQARVQGAFLEGLYLLKDYARQHVLLCLVPAFFIAGAISHFVRQGAVMRYLGASAPRPVAYGVSSVSGAILAVCSCTVLPLFAGIYKRGAGLGPAIAFLYSGPAINVLAIILTARVLGIRIGVARAVGAVAFAAVIGVIMAALFRKEDAARLSDGPDPFALASEGEAPRRRGWQDAAFLGVMVAALVLANWGAPNQAVGVFAAIHSVHWHLTGALLVALGWMILRWFDREELAGWMEATWAFAKQITPLLLGGILVSGWLMGRPGMDNGLIPSAWVASSVGGNSLLANLASSVVGAFMYFATLTEVPILQALLGSGMGQGPALALLLAGPALSLPNMLVINSYLGPRKTSTYVALVIAMATATGLMFGAMTPGGAP
ncbi:MAG TPA: permease [Thermoanaerobaculaceae bacterium]|nr:permease [Thermoanaerobaculaceae bacterium]HRS16420.1 permease [Thermoanaerobaculaceae bacterium]